MDGKQKRKLTGYYRNLIKSPLDVRKERETTKTWKDGDIFDIEVSLFL